jgi:hypothetical protein
MHMLVRGKKGKVIRVTFIVCILVCVIQEICKMGQSARILTEKNLMLQYQQLVLLAQMLTLHLILLIFGPSH